MFLFPPLRRPWARLWGHRAERGGVKGGIAPAPMTVDPRQWSAGGSGTGEFSVEEEIPRVQEHQGREFRSGSF